MHLRRENSKALDRIASSTYYPQLDFLRAIAVSLVIVSHWFPSDHLLNRYTPNGFFGVNLFFVLSGFLITRILLNYRKNAERDNTIMRRDLIRRFYVSRGLRIFPVYFLTLLIVTVWNIGLIRETLGWYISYTSNFLYFNEGIVTAASHLWSLGVEEQFYLLWPLLILFIPGRYLLHGILGAVLLAPLFRLYIGLGSPTQLVNVLTPSCFDAFGAGGLMAFCLAYPSTLFARHFRKGLWVAFGVATLFFIYMGLTHISGSNIFSRMEMVVFGRLAASAISLGLIYLAVKGIKGKVRLLVENPAVLFIGKISYSLYLFHHFLPNVLQHFGIHLPFTTFNIAIQSMLLLSLSVASWYLLERPVNRYRKRFSTENTEALTSPAAT